MQASQPSNKPSGHHSSCPGAHWHQPCLRNQQLSTFGAVAWAGCAHLHGRQQQAGLQCGCEPMRAAAVQPVSGSQYMVEAVFLQHACMAVANVCFCHGCGPKHAWQTAGRYGACMECRTCMIITTHMHAWVAAAMQQHVYPCSPHMAA